MFALETIKRNGLSKALATIRFCTYPQIKPKPLEIKRFAPNIYFDYCLDSINTTNEDREDRPQSRPLVVLMSWLRAKDKYLDLYNDLYMKRGFDVLTAKVTGYDMFYPDYTGKLCLNILEKELPHYDSIIVHAFSFGVYVLGTMLLEMEKRNGNNGNIVDGIRGPQIGMALDNRIKAVVLDSLVTADLILGLSESLNGLPKSYKLYMKSHQMFLKLHKNTTNYLLAANEVIFNSPLRAPALVMVSESDPFGNVVLSEKIVNIWRNKDIDVKYQRWKNGHHVQLMKYNQTEYGQLIDQLIYKTQIKSKIIEI